MSAASGLLAERAADLADAGLEQAGGDGLKFEEKTGGSAGGCEIGSVCDAEGLDAGGALGAAEIVVVYEERW